MGPSSFTHRREIFFHFYIFVGGKKLPRPIQSILPIKTLRGRLPHSWFCHSHSCFYRSHSHSRFFLHLDAPPPPPCDPLSRSMSAPAVTPAAHRTKPPRDLGARPLTMATTTSPTSASSVPLPLLHRRRGILGHVPPEAPAHALRPPRGHQGPATASPSPCRRAVERRRRSGSGGSCRSSRHSAPPCRPTASCPWPTGSGTSGSASRSHGSTSTASCRPRRRWRRPSGSRMRRCPQRASRWRRRARCYEPRRWRRRTRGFGSLAPAPCRTRDFVRLFCDAAGPNAGPSVARALDESGSSPSSTLASRASPPPIPSRAAPPSRSSSAISSPSSTSASRRRRLLLSPPSIPLKRTTESRLQFLRPIRPSHQPRATPPAATRQDPDAKEDGRELQGRGGLRASLHRGGRLARPLRGRRGGAVLGRLPAFLAVVCTDFSSYTTDPSHPIRPASLNRTS
jgi:hypothetical protein